MTTIKDAFPRKLADAVDRVTPLLTNNARFEPAGIFSIVCDGEVIRAPYRIYSEPPPEAHLRELKGDDWLIVACWFTRHHDGRIRETFLDAIPAFDQPWVVPYVLALCGEYIVEILQRVDQRHSSFDRATLGRLIRDNSTFYSRICSRVVSYWNCYYRQRYPRFGDYTGSRLLSFFEDCRLTSELESPGMIFGIGIGSNAGDRAANLRRGLELLLQRLPRGCLVAHGGVYETEPVDCVPGTQAFLNLVIEIRTPIPPRSLHEHLAAIEQELGRPAQREKNAPRTLDLDLLYAGDFVSDDPSLTVPHPRLHLRRFVLQPLADIRPDLKLPGHDRTIAEHLAALQDDPSCVKRVAASC